MKRTLIVVALFGALCFAGAGIAQPPSGGKKKAPPAAEQQDDVLALQKMLEKLRAQLDVVESQIRKAQAATEPEKKEGGKKGKNDFGGPDGGEKKGKKGAGSPDGNTKDAPDTPGKKEFKGGFGPGGFGKKGFGPGGEGFGPGAGFKGFGKKEGFEKKEEKAAPTPGNATIEERLDRLLRELEEIRRELRQK